MKHFPALIVRLTPATEAGLETVGELLAAALDDFGPTAIQEYDAEWRVFFSTPPDRDRAAAGVVSALPGVVIVEAIDVPDEDWARRSQQDLGAVHVGLVTISPPWLPQPEDGRLSIVIQPSMGFGTGHHASTRLCTALLQRVEVSGRRVLDVGTGSGVLALVARALGARSVVAVDDDADAIEAARENLDLNRVRDGIDLRVSDFRSLAAEPADVVTANLTGGLLIRGAAVLADAVARGGDLVMSGVTKDEEADVLAAFTPAFELVERIAEDEWMAAWLRKI